MKYDVFGIGNAIVDIVTEVDAQAFADTLSAQFTKPEFQIVNGGQPLYPYIIGVE